MMAGLEDRPSKAAKDEADQYPKRDARVYVLAPSIRRRAHASPVSNRRVTAVDAKFRASPSARRI